MDEHELLEKHMTEGTTNDSAIDVLTVFEEMRVHVLSAGFKMIRVDMSPDYFWKLNSMVETKWTKGSESLCLAIYGIIIRPDDELKGNEVKIHGRM